MPSGVPDSSGAELERLLGPALWLFHCPAIFIFKFFGTKTFKRPVLASAWVRAAEGKDGRTPSTDACLLDKLGRMQGSFLSTGCWGHPQFLERTHEGKPFSLVSCPILPFPSSPAHLGLKREGLKHEMDGHKLCREPHSKGKESR